MIHRDDKPHVCESCDRLLENYRPEFFPDIPDPFDPAEPSRFQPASVAAALSGEPEVLNHDIFGDFEISQQKTANGLRMVARGICPKVFWSCYPTREDRPESVGTKREVSANGKSTWILSIWGDTVAEVEREFDVIMADLSQYQALVDRMQGRRRPR